jgi:L-ascorbate metabolism protein UlaG (beta-lactamase superfamily)
MGSDDAVIAASFIQASYVVPIHYNTRDKIKADDIEFARQVLL